MLRQCVARQLDGPWREQQHAVLAIRRRSGEQRNIGSVAVGERQQPDALKEALVALVDRDLAVLPGHRALP